MATPFSNVYSRFLQKITDYRLASLVSSDFDNRMLGWMKSAIPKFAKCKTDLSDRNETSKQFNQTLSDYEEEILSSLMVVEWLEPEVKDIMDMQNVLFNSDFKTYSSANLLKEKKELLEFELKKSDSLIVSYTYDTLDYGKLC